MMVRVSILEQTVPPVPAEKDESIDLTDLRPRKVMKQAAEDIAKGLKDTDRGMQTDLTYKKLKSKK
jgi:hypothetical protein